MQNTEDLQVDTLLYRQKLFEYGRLYDINHQQFQAVLRDVLQTNDKTGFELVLDFNVAANVRQDFFDPFRRGWNVPTEKPDGTCAPRVPFR